TTKVPTRPSYPPLPTPSPPRSSPCPHFHSKASTRHLESPPGPTPADRDLPQSARPPHSQTVSGKTPPEPVETTVPPPHPSNSAASFRPAQSHPPWPYCPRPRSHSPGSA